MEALRMRAKLNALIVGLGLTVAAPGQQSSADASDAVVAQARAGGQVVRP